MKNTYFNSARVDGIEIFAIEMSSVTQNWLIISDGQRS